MLYFNAQLPRVAKIKNCKVCQLSLGPQRHFSFVLTFVTLHHLCGTKLNTVANVLKYMLWNNQMSHISSPSAHRTFFYTVMSTNVDLNTKHSFYFQCQKHSQECCGKLNTVKSWNMRTRTSTAPTFSTTDSTRTEKAPSWDMAHGGKKKKKPTQSDNFYSK